MIQDTEAALTIQLKWKETSGAALESVKNDGISVF